MPVKIRHQLLKQPKLESLYKFYKRLRVTQYSPYDNIYHCCTQKTASQWFKKIFSDPIFYQYTGLEVYPFKQFPARFQDAHFDKALPKRTVGTHLYIDYPTYTSILKPEKYKTFFILRDPRDIVVSWYFSVFYSHPENKIISDIRQKLKRLSSSEGLKYSIAYLEENGLFEGQKSWAKRGGQQLKVFKYEELAKDNLSFLNQLFAFLEINIPQEKITILYEKHQFSKYSGGRSQGVEDLQAHYRKGFPGDWKSHFDSSTKTYFQKVTKDLLGQLNYFE